MRKKTAIVLTLFLSICLAFAAGCLEEVDSLTVKFDSNGGTEIADLQVESGEKVTKPEAPEKEHYVFGGWYNGDTEWVFETDTVEKDMTLTAKWTPEVYSVTFKNYDGAELAKENVSYGSLPQYSATPEKLGNAQYSYVFARWVDENGQTVDLANIGRNIILTAVFTETLNTYKVTFKNGDEVLKEEQVEYGTVPTAPANPTKAADAQYTYTFKDWGKEITAVTGEIVYNAVFTKTLNTYKVMFKNGDEVLKEEQVEYGTVPTAPANPTKAADAQYTYTFKDWDKTITAVTGEIVYNAIFTKTLNTYKVTFKNGDEVLKEELVEYGVVPTAPANPTKAADAQYTYTFKDWGKEITAVTGEIVYNAEFTKTLNTYKVTFKNGDEVLKEEQVEYGVVPTAPANPTKAADAQYTYTFKDWGKEITAVTGEIVYNAVFTKTLNTYKVTFKNGDEVLKEEQVEYGVVPTAPANPTKAADAQYTYTFKGWDKKITAVTGEAVYNAEFTETLNKYKVTFKNGDEVLKEEQVEYGVVPTAPANPTKAADAQYTYTFKGWDKAITAVTGEIVYNAVFTKTLNKYKVTFKNGDEVLKEEQVEYGTVPTAPETNPSKDVDAENHYVFDGWDKEIAEVTCEIVYNALFKAEAHVYTVDSSDDTFDYIVCSCGYRDETYSYDKTVTSARKELVVSASGLALAIEGASYASVEKMTINGVEINGEITSFAIPDEIKADKERHGLQNVIVTVKDEQGYSHELQVPVILVTEEIKDLNGLNTALKGEGDEYAIYGYYKLVADLGAANYDGIQNGSSSKNWSNANGEYGFRGTFDGNDKSISAIIYNNGIFGIVGKGAYIKNLTVNSYKYSNGRTILARTITEATIENVTINVISGSSDSYYAEGGVITALLSHSSKYINVKIKSSSDLDTLFGFSYWNYNPAKPNTFENCTVEARSIGGIICITTKANMAEPIVSIAGVKGLNVTLNKDAVAADNMTVGQAAVIELPDLTEITSIVLDNEEFTAYSFENGVLTINADAFTAFQIGVKKFGVTAKNKQGLTVVFEITMTVELVADPVTLEGNREIVLSDASDYAVDLGEYAASTVISSTFAGENATFAGGKLTITDAFKANKQKHGMQTLKVTVLKGDKYYVLTANVLVVTKTISTINELNTALKGEGDEYAIYGYYKLVADLGAANYDGIQNGSSSKNWSNANGEYGFRGTFDGNDKSISAIIYNNGIFGIVGKGAYIKNLTVNSYKYSNGRTILARTITEATIENVTINVISGSSDSYYAEGGVITALLSHSSKYINVKIKSSSDLDTLFGFSYWNYNPAKPNTFENCTVEARSIGGIICITTKANMAEPIVSIAGVKGLNVTLNKDAVAADNMTVGQAAVIELPDLTEITSIVLDNEEFTAYSFENGVLTINADAFTAFQIGVKKFGVTAKNKQGLTVVFEITMTVELVADPVTLEGNREIVLSDASDYAVDLGEYAASTVISSTFAGENATFADGKLTITDALKANKQKHGMQTLKVTVLKDGKYYVVTANVLVVTKAISTINELTAALTAGTDNVVYGYYRLTQNVGSSEAWINVANNGSWQNVDGSVGFRGTLDGNGFAVDGAFATHGLFGIIGNGAVVKNITFNVYYYQNNRQTLARSITGATIEGVTINIKSIHGILDATKEGGVITGLMSHTTHYKDVTINAEGKDIDTLFGMSYGNYKAEKANTFENCVVNAKSLAGLVHSNEIISAAGIDGLTIPQ